MKQLTLAAVMLFSTALIAAPAFAQSPPPRTTSAISVPLTGAGGGGTFAGTFRLQQFAVNQGQVVATGLLSGILTAADGTTTSCTVANLLNNPSGLAALLNQILAAL